MSEIAKVFWYSIPLDISTACYLSFIPWILLTIQLFWHHPALKRVHLVYSLLMICLVSTILVSELEIYSQWGTKLSVKVFPYLLQPTEMVAILKHINKLLNTSYDYDFIK